MRCHLYAVLLLIAVDSRPIIGGMIFIDLFRPGGIGHGQVTHVSIVEYVNGSTAGILQGNGNRSNVIPRTTYELGDSRIVDFTPFRKEAA
jgi:hypothetical protein